MRRLIFAMLAVGLAGAAQAQTFPDAVVAQLRDQGYAGVTVSETWLGRYRITGTLDGQRREIVINPSTGEILRDYLSGAALADRGDAGDTISPRSSGATSGASTLGAASSVAGAGDVLDLQRLENDSGNP